MNKEELERLSKFKEQICRDRCEEYGTCVDCYIEFEDVQVVEKLLNNYNNLIKYLKNKIQHHNINVKQLRQKYNNHLADVSNDSFKMKIYQDILERVKSGKYVDK